MGKGGFSLLELLVALTLLSVIAVGLASALQLGTETYSRSKLLGSEVHIGMARSQTRHLIARAARPSVDGNFESLFVGNPESLQFVTTTTPEFARNAARTAVSLKLEGQDFVAVLRFLDGENSSVGQATILVSSNVESVSLSYLGSTGWQTSWTDETTLPRLTRLEMTDEDGSMWPAFVVEHLYSP